MQVHHYSERRVRRERHEHHEHHEHHVHHQEHRINRERCGHHHHHERHHRHHNHRPRIAPPCRQVLQMPRRSPNFRLQTVCLYIPHPDKFRTLGEDATFLSSKAIGVFDGVGSWARQGVSSGKYARQMARLTEKNLNRGMNPSRALHAASRENNLQGSCTACVFHISGQKLQGLNVGDSGLKIVRNGRLVFRTQSQIRGFNAPFQLQYGNSNDFHNSREMEFDLKERDLILTSSDGLTDNMFEGDILETIRQQERAIRHGHAPTSFSGEIHHSERVEGQRTRTSKERSNMLGGIASALGNKSCAVAHSSSAASPFSESARRADVQHAGGKLDDMTIVISMVVATQDRYSSRHLARCSHRHHWYLVLSVAQRF